MGIKHSFIRLLCGKSKTQDDQNDETSFMGKIFSIHKFFYNALKGVVHKLRCFVLKPKNSAEPILPVVDPTSNIINEPVLVEISSPHVIIEEDSSVACVEESTTLVEVEKTEEDAKWIKHYCNRHRILLVGEGDFSFSASLAVAFGDQASNMVATSLNSKTFLKKNYWNAALNIKELRNRGCMVMHGIDATEIANHESLGLMTFDRIIFNFPFAGFFDNLSSKSQLRRHRQLVSLFLKNAKEMISEDGEIHVTHKTNGWHGEWKLEAIASSHNLRLIEAVDFNLLDYPGYNTKYGFGGDENFNCTPSKTYKFGV